MCPPQAVFFLKIRLKLAYFSYILTLFLSKSEGAKTYFGPLTLKSEGPMAPWPPYTTGVSSYSFHHLNIFHFPVNPWGHTLLL